MEDFVKIQEILQKAAARISDWDTAVEYYRRALQEDPRPAGFAPATLGFEGLSWGQPCEMRTDLAENTGLIGYGQAVIPACARTVRTHRFPSTRPRSGSSGQDC